MKSEGMRQLRPQTILAAVGGLSTLPFLAVELFPSRLYVTMDIAQYLVFHNVAEFFSVLVSLSIFGIGWYTYDQSKDRHALFLSTAFLAIGLMDFMHTLSYSGMPAFITPNSANKSTQFWIAVRVYTAAVFLISAYIYHDSPGRYLSKRNLLASASVISGLVFIGIIYFPASMPVTFREGSGLTPFKVVSEYLIISDTGIGIKPEDIPKLFHESTQLESAYTKTFEGTGLGLALTRRLVELHGGTIWVDSKFGKGSTFTFAIPARQSFKEA